MLPRTKKRCISSSPGSLISTINNNAALRVHRVRRGIASSTTRVPAAACLVASASTCRRDSRSPGTSLPTGRLLNPWGSQWPSPSRGATACRLRRHLKVDAVRLRNRAVVVVLLLLLPCACEYDRVAGGEEATALCVVRGASPGPLLTSSSRQSRKSKR